MGGQGRRWEGSHLCVRHRLHAINELVQETGVQLEEGADHVEGGDGHEQPAVMTDEVQARLHQPPKQVLQERPVVLHQPCEGVPVGLSHSIRH